MTEREYARDLLKRINSLLIEGVPIHAYFHEYYDGTGHSFWASQQFHLFKETKTFAKLKTYEKYAKRSPIRWYAGPVNLVLEAIALFSTIIALVNLRFSKTKVLTYSVDHLKPGTKLDPRLVEVYSVLQESGVSYQEIIHTLLGKKFLKNFLKRKKFPIYLESLRLFFVLFKDDDKEKRYLTDMSKLDLVEFSDDEKLFVRDILRNFALKCLESEYKIHLLQKIFSKSSIEKFISIDDPRYANELYVATKLAGVEAHVFQHSNFDWLYGLDTLPPGVYAFPEYFYVWNDYWMSRITEISPLFKFYSSHLRIGGRTNGYETGTPLYKKEKTKDIKVLIPYESNLDKDDFKEFFDELLKCEDVSFVFKGRPDINLEAQVKEYMLEVLVREEMVRATVVLSDDEILDIDVVVGVYTSLIDEYIQRAKPALIYQTDYPVVNNLVDAGVASGVNKKSGTICQKLAEVASISEEIAMKNREILLQGTVDSREVVKKLISHL